MIHFQQAVSFIDNGEAEELEHLPMSHPGLVSKRLESPGDWLRELAGGALGVISNNLISFGSLPTNQFALINCLRILQQ